MYDRVMHAYVGAAPSAARPATPARPAHRYLSAESINEVLESEGQNSQPGQGERRRHINKKGKEVTELQPA